MWNVPIFQKLCGPNKIICQLDSICGLPVCDPWSKSKWNYFQRSSPNVSLDGWGLGVAEKCSQRYLIPRYNKVGRWCGLWLASWTGDGIGEEGEGEPCADGSFWDFWGFSVSFLAPPSVNSAGMWRDVELCRDQQGSAGMWVMTEDISNLVEYWKQT